MALIPIFITTELSRKGISNGSCPSCKRQGLVECDGYMKVYWIISMPVETIFYCDNCKRLSQKNGFFARFILTIYIAIMFIFMSIPIGGALYIFWQMLSARHFDATLAIVAAIGLALGGYISRLLIQKLRQVLDTKSLVAMDIQNYAWKNSADKAS